MSEEPEHFLDSVGGFIGSFLAGSQGYDPHLGHWLGRNATRFTRGLFSSNEATPEQILTLYAAIFRHMAASDGGLDDGRRERIVRILTLLNANVSPSLDALALRRIAEDGSRDDETIQVVQQELSKDVEVAYIVLEVCFRLAAMEVTISDGMLGWLRSSAIGVGLPQDRFADLLVLYHRAQPDDVRRLEAAKLLGVPVGASRDEADAAFEKLATPYHPDRTQGLPPEIAALSAAKYRELGEAHDVFLIPTKWWARNSSRIEAVAVTHQAFVACFTCGKSVALPPPDLHWIARCPDCLLLLLHSKEVTDIIVGNLKPADRSDMPTQSPTNDVPSSSEPRSDSAAVNTNDAHREAMLAANPTVSRNAGSILRVFEGFSCDGFFVNPAIPSDKLQRAIGSYAPELKAVDVLVLADTTMFGTATEGFLITPTGIHWRNPGAQAKQLRYREIDSVRHIKTSSVFSAAKIRVNNEEIEVSIAGIKQQNRIAQLVATAIESVSPLAQHAHDKGTETIATADARQGKCPHCGKGYVAAGSNLGCDIQCMACKKTFAMTTSNSWN